ncbi:MAG: HAD family phosphatase [Candidatus Tectomicrobia bacterium]|nr:HAD family phosphatase [Candidatus Tectomicrobia bacterium]
MQWDGKGSTKRKIQAIVFDMDGLIVDTEKLYFEVESAVARKYGKTFTREVMRAMMGKRGIESLRVLQEQLGIDEDPYVLLEMREQGYNQLLYEKLEPMPGLFSLLELTEGHRYRKAIATSSPASQMNFIVDRLGVRHFFELLMSGEEVEYGKPHPEIYQKIAERLGLQSNQCLVLEDTEVGVRAAKGAEMYCIAVPNEFTKDHDFTLADLVVSSLEEVDLALIQSFG